MKNVAKTILAFGVGTLVGAFSAKVYLQKKYDKKIDEIAAQIKSDYDNRYAKEHANDCVVANIPKTSESESDDENDSDSDEEETKPVEEVFSDDNHTEDEETTTTRIKKKDHYVDYTSYFKPNAEEFKEYIDLLEGNGYAANSTTEQLQEKLDAFAKERERDLDPLSHTEIIDPDVKEFGVVFEIDEFDYWTDGVLTDSTGFKVEDPYFLVGNRFMRHFGDFQEDICYVRNYQNQTDYEITLNDMTFAEAVSKGWARNG